MQRLALLSAGTVGALGGALLAWNAQRILAHRPAAARPAASDPRRVRQPFSDER